jgi:hypothetical protein
MSDGAEAEHGVRQEIESLLHTGRVLAAKPLLDRLDPVAKEAIAQLATQVETACAEVEAALVAVEHPSSSDEWTLALDGDLLTFYRPPVEEHVHGVWFSGTLGSTTQHVVSLAREFDLVSSFAGRFLFDTRIVNVERLLSLTVYSALWVPVFTDRDFAVTACGYDCLDEHGCVIIVFQDAAERYESQLPVEASSRVRLRFKRSFLQLCPRPGNRTRATLVCDINPRMPGDIDVPAWLVNWALAHMCPFIWSRANAVVASVCRSETCPYAARMEANPALYALVASREEAVRVKLAGDDPEDAAPAQAHDAYPPGAGTGMFSRLAAAWRGDAEVPMPV